MPNQDKSPLTTVAIRRRMEVLPTFDGAQER